MENFPDVLIVSGTARKVGKTSLACEIIRKNSLEHDIVAVKVTPHNHVDMRGMLTLEQNDSFSVFLQQEENMSDTSKFMSAGARYSYLVYCQQVNLYHAFRWVVNKHKDANFLIESRSLDSLIKPGILIIVGKNEKEKPEVGHHAIYLDENISFRKFSFKIHLDKSGWNIEV